MLGFQMPGSLNPGGSVSSGRARGVIGRSCWRLDELTVGIM
jgi:hypothetical protein